MHPEICWIFGTTWPCLTPSEWANWTQAVFTLIGLGVAILVPTLQRHFQLKDEKRKEETAREIVAGALVHPVNATRAGAAVVRNAIERGDSSVQIANLNPIYLEKAPEYEQFRTQLYLLGSTGSQVNLLIGWLHIPRAYVEACKVAGQRVIPDEHKQKILRELDVIIRVAKKLEDELEKLAGATEHV